MVVLERAGWFASPRLLSPARSGIASSATTRLIGRRAGTVMRKSGARRAGRRACGLPGRSPEMQGLSLARQVPAAELNRGLSIQPPEPGSFIHVPQVHATQAMRAPEPALQGSV